MKSNIAKCEVSSSSSTTSSNSGSTVSSFSTCNDVDLESITIDVEVEIVIVKEQKTFPTEGAEGDSDQHSQSILRDRNRSSTPSSSSCSTSLSPFSSLSYINPTENSSFYVESCDLVFLWLSPKRLNCQSRTKWIKVNRSLHILDGIRTPKECYRCIFSTVFRSCIFSSE